MAPKLHSPKAKPDGTTADGWRGVRCGHCGSDISAAVLAYAEPGHDHSPQFYWMRCPKCLLGIIEDEYGIVWPAANVIPAVEGLPPDVHRAFDEARTCYSSGCFAAAELICRKIIMHVAVEKGAEEGTTFAAYIDHLSESGYVTPPMKPWVELIRKHGNSATHTLDQVPQTRAQSTVLFTAEFLRLVYEMDSFAKRFTAPEAD